jgi:hypothetical protein
MSTPQDSYVKKMATVPLSRCGEQTAEWLMTAVRELAQKQVESKLPIKGRAFQPSSHVKRQTLEAHRPPPAHEEDRQLINALISRQRGKARFFHPVPSQASTATQE